jgi:hypothetical protein
MEFVEGVEVNQENQELDEAGVADGTFDTDPTLLLRLFRIDTLFPLRRLFPETGPAEFISTFSV